MAPEPVVSNTRHVVPVGDAVEHDSDTDQPDCVCGPRVEFVPNEVGGPDGWLIVHNSLDGREHREHDE